MTIRSLCRFGKECASDECLCISCNVYIDGTLRFTNFVAKDEAMPFDVLQNLRTIERWKVKLSHSQKAIYERCVKPYE